MTELCLDDLQALVEPCLLEQSVELVELTCRPQGRQLHIRLLVDKVGGITMQECARLNGRIAKALEDSDVIEGSYLLEVSSPGADRPLVTDRDFTRALGETLEVEVVEETQRTKELTGQLLAVQPTAIVLKVAAEKITVPRDVIRRARKALKWK